MADFFRLFKKQNKGEPCLTEKCNGINISLKVMRHVTLEEVEQEVTDDIMSIWVASVQVEDAAWKCEYYIHGKGRCSYSSSIRSCKGRKESYLLTILEAIQCIDKFEDICAVVLEESIFGSSYNGNEVEEALRDRLIDIIKERQICFEELVCVDVANMGDRRHMMPIFWRAINDLKKRDQSKEQ